MRACPPIPRPWRAAACALALALAGCHWPWQEAPAGAPLQLSGTVDARQVDIAFQVPGRIERLAADEGQPVQPGQLLARLDPGDLQLAASRAEAQAVAAAKVLAALRAGARPQELRAAAAAVAQAGADARFAAQEVVRTRQLVDQQFVAAQQMDRVQSAADAAVARLEQARQNEALLRAGARREDVERAEADLKAAAAARDAARRQLSQVEVTSPVAGVVSVRVAEAGQVVAAGQPVLRLSELARPWVRIYLPEADLARVRLGQAAEVRVDGRPGQVFAGRLSFVAPQAEFTPKTVETRALRVDLVYRAKVEVDNAGGLLKIGMPADVSLPLERSPG
ncbi:efflux RND transporter periplasmic adaptor subunit [Caenimonas terrae]|uniref:Efflux RND transporter periplasmic adaptor subunit n=1 Tax=Caenimonas terrae TaxID=696074 RepID=A0ABW0NH24_9BURK